MKKNFTKVVASLTLFTVLLGYAGVELSIQDNNHEIKVKLPENDKH